MAKRSYCYTIRTLYGLAKSEEIGLTDELLHLLVQRETGKTSIRAMTPSEIARVCRVLQKQKDDAKRRNGVLKEGGNPVTARQRRKICLLEADLGWCENKSRLRGLIKRMFKVDALEWLDDKQCQALIEAMKAILARQKEGEKRGEE